MTGHDKSWLARPRLRPAILAIAVTFCGVMPAAGQFSAAGRTQASDLEPQSSSALKGEPQC